MLPWIQSCTTAKSIGTVACSPEHKTKDICIRLKFICQIYYFWYTLYFQKVNRVVLPMQSKQFEGMNLSNKPMLFVFFFFLCSHIILSCEKSSSQLDKEILSFENCALMSEELHVTSTLIANEFSMSTMVTVRINNDRPLVIVMNCQTAY